MRGHPKPIDNSPISFADRLICSNNDLSHGNQSDVGFGKTFDNPQKLGSLWIGLISRGIPRSILVQSNIWP